MGTGKIDFRSVSKIVLEMLNNPEMAEKIS
jgi:hypothetical protein